MPLHHTDSGINVKEGVAEIVDCLIFWMAEHEVMKRVPDLEHHTVLGLHTQKWIEVSLFILIAYNVISLSTHLIQVSSRRKA